jgi:hypothetical protein
MPTLGQRDKEIERKLILLNDLDGRERDAALTKPVHDAAHAAEFTNLGMQIGGGDEE